MTLTRAIRRSLLKPRALIEFYELMSALIGSGFDREEALEMARITLKRRGRSNAAAMAQDMSESIASNTLKDCALSYARSGDELILSQIGQKEDQKIFSGVARIHRTRAIIRAAILSSLAYPMVNIIALFLLVVMLHMQFLPLVLSMDGLSPSPAIRTLYQTASWVADKFIPLAISLILYWGALAVYMSRGDSWLRREIMDRLLISYRLYKINLAVGFYLTMIEVHRMGEDANSKTLESFARHQPPYAAKAIRRISKGLDQEQSLGSAILNADPNWPDPELNVIFAALDRREGGIEAFARYFETWITRTQTTIKALAHIVNVIALTGVALAIIGLILIISQIVLNIQI